MSNINSLLEKLLSAVYGREVRQTIHDAFKFCHNEIIKGDTEIRQIANNAGVLATEAKELAEETKGGVVLWKGRATAGAGDDFFIPEECFHHNRTTLTLMIESYTMASGSAAGCGNAPVFITLVIGTVKDLIGTELGSGYDPYVDKNGDSVGDIYTNAHESATAEDNLLITLFARKTTDSRYAVGMFELSSQTDPDIAVTSISAIIPKDLEDEV